jgi:hypothetical protein
MTFDPDQVRQLVRAANPIPDPGSLAPIPWVEPVDGVGDDPGTKRVPTVPTRPPLPRLRGQAAFALSVQAAFALTITAVLVMAGAVLLTTPPAISGPLAPVALPVGQSVVLTDVGCSIGEIDRLSPGRFAVVVQNDSSSTANFELFRLEVTWDEFAAYYAEEHEILQSGQEPRVERGIGVLPAATDVHRVMLLEPGGSAALVGDLTEGSYAVLCETVEVGGDRPGDFSYTGVLSVGPFEVID